MGDTAKLLMLLDQPQKIDSAGLSRVLAIHGLTDEFEKFKEH